MVGGFEQYVTRSEYWRRQYANAPYLEAASRAALGQRFADISANLFRLQEQGAFRPAPVNRDIRKTGWWEMVSDVMTECDRRGFHFSEIGKLAKRRQDQWPLEGTPRGYAILGGSVPPNPCLVRVSKQQYVADALLEGRFFIKPATSYDDPSLNAAVRDDELMIARVAPLRGLHSQMYDATGSRVEGVPLRAEVSFSQRMTGDYFVLCFSQSYDYAYLDDFTADSALIITDRARFLEELRRAAAVARPDLEMSSGPVRYYDPYLHRVSARWIPMLKHFRYAYQDEFRVVWTSKNPACSFEPFFVSLGPMSEYAVAYGI